MTFRGADNPARGWHEAADEALLCGFLRGEQAMAAELVRRYEQPLYRFLRRLSGNPSDVPDLFQETFLRRREMPGRSAAGAVSSPGCTPSPSTCAAPTPAVRGGNR